MTSNWVIFLKGTHLTNKDKKNWQDERNVQLFFTHGKSNSCRVAIGFSETKIL